MHYRRMFKGYRLAALLVVILSVIALGTLLTLTKLRHSNPIPASIRQTTAYNLYYPAQLPDGWTLDRQSFQQSSELVTYKLHGPAESLTVSQQQRPEGLNFTEITGRLQERTSFTTPLGEAFVGVSSNQRLASLTTTTTWLIIINPNKTVSADTLQQILKGMAN